MLFLFKALEHLRKKIEISTEKIRVAKLKEDQAKKVLIWTAASPPFVYGFRFNNFSLSHFKCLARKHVNMVNNMIVT